MTPLKKILKSIESFTPIPAVAHKIISIINTSNFSMNDIAQIIQHDPALSANLLKTCNSAFFALQTPIESIKDAVSLLGIDQVVELVLLKSGRQILNKKQKGYGIHGESIWNYSVSSALIAKDIADKFSPDNRHLIFTAALLKDIGKIVLDKFIVDSSDKINKLVKKQDYSFLEAEKKIIGADHAEVGGMIAKMWNFSPQMYKIIRHHHLCDKSMRKDKNIAIVYISDCICMMMGTGVGSDALAYRFHDQVLTDLGMGPNDITAIIADFTFNIKKVQDLLCVV